MVKLTLDFSSLDMIEAESHRVRLMLIRVEEELDPELQRVLLEHAEMMKMLARTYQAPHIDTKSLWKSIRVENIRRHHIAIRSGGYIVNPKTKRLVDYAGYHEARFPFMRPAYKHVSPMLEQAIDDLMIEWTEMV